MNPETRKELVERLWWRLRYRLLQRGFVEFHPNGQSWKCYPGEKKIPLGTHYVQRTHGKTWSSWAPRYWYRRGFIAR